MHFQRIEVEYHFFAAIVRFTTPRRGQRYDCVELRDEMMTLVNQDPLQGMIVDFGDFQLYPAELLGCLAHAKQKLPADELIRCVDLPLRLQVASRLLRFEGVILRQYDSVEQALFSVPDSTNTTVVTPALSNSAWNFAA